jgi:hypothetical protein
MGDNTQATGQSCCGRSGCSVLGEFGIPLDSKVYIHLAMFAHNSDLCELGVHCDSSVRSILPAIRVRTAYENLAQCSGER